MIGKLSRQLLQEGHDTLAMDIRGVGDGHHFVGNGMERAQNVEALAPGGRRQQNAVQTPEVPEPSAQDKVGRVAKKDMAGARLGFL